MENEKEMKNEKDFEQVNKQHNKEINKKTEQHSKDENLMCDYEHPLYEEENICQCECIVDSYEDVISDCDCHCEKEFNIFHL